jgi:hypothetical protein
VRNSVVIIDGSIIWVKYITLKSYRINLVLLAMALIFIELGCAITFRVFHKRFTFFHVEDFLVTQERIERSRRGLDSELGWITPFDTPYGERPRPVNYSNPLMSTFGDSYTFGSEVTEHQTFQSKLAEILQADVFNFGVGAYGTDQALLRFRRDFPKLRTPIVSIGLITENINRIVNRYRPFYIAGTRCPLTKPRFILDQKELLLIPNPLRTASDYYRLTDINYVWSLGENDYWFNRLNQPKLRFPYSGIFLNRYFWQEFWYGQMGERPNDVNARPWENLWNDKEARSLMTAILKAFVLEAKAQGSTPVILLSPQRAELLKQLKKKDNPQATILMNICLEEKWQCFNGISALASFITSENDVSRVTGRYHLTAYGNLLYAKSLHDWLVKEKLIPVY